MSARGSPRLKELSKLMPEGSVPGLVTEKYGPAWNRNRPPLRTCPPPGRGLGWLCWLEVSYQVRNHPMGTREGHVAIINSGVVVVTGLATALAHK